MSQSILAVDQQLAAFTALAQGGPFGLVVVDRQFRVVEINPTLAALHAMPREAQLGRTVEEIVPAFWPALAPLYRRALEGVAVLKQEVAGTAGAAQNVAHWLVSLHPVWTQGAVNALAVVVDDITEQRRAENALRVRNELYAMLARTHRTISRSRSALELYRDLCTIAVETGRFPLAWVGVPEDGRIRAVAWAGPGSGYLDALTVTLSDDDPRSRGPTGHAALTGSTVVINDYQAAAMTAPWHALAARYGFAASAAFPLRERGKVVAVLTVYAPVVGFFSDDLLETLGEIMPSVSFALDTLCLEQERRRDEAALRLRDRAMQAVSQGICISDALQPGYPLIYVSPGFEALTGYAAHEVSGQNCGFLQGPDSDAEMIAEMRSARRERRECTVELLNYRKDGTTFWNNLTIAPVRDDVGKVVQFIAVQTDVTARRRMEEQLRQAQKLEAIGMLAGGIAHDFNNLLTVINGYAALLLSRMPGSDLARPSLLEIHNAGERAASLTRQLLAYSRQQLLERRVLCLNDVVRDVETMLVRLIGEDIDLSVQTTTDLWPVKVDRGQIEQIIINLLVNARDAMPRGGAVRIATGNFHHAPSDRSEFDAMPSGDYAELTLSDNGEGMDDDTRRRMFDPFFTTKEKGRGTGMGLAMVLGIVKQSHGFIFVDSAPQQGTTVRIFLPRSTEQLTVQAADEQISLPQGSATILLVEDEQALRVLTRHIFEACGYTVLEAADGRDALDVADGYDGVIDLLVSDVVMPQLNGRELADELRRRRPGCRCLLLSGYSEDATLPDGVATVGYEFLAKPFTPEALAQKVYGMVTADF